MGAAPRQQVRALGVALLCAICSVLSLVGCAQSADRAELPATSEVIRYKGDWEYRYGSSPLGADGTPLYAAPIAADPAAREGWRPTTRPTNPPGRSGQDLLWLRLRLPAPTQPDGVVFLFSVEQNFVAYLDGKIIGRLGPMAGTATRRYAARRTIYLPVGSDYAGKTLTLQIQSPHYAIGITGVPLIGSRGAVVTAVTRIGLPLITVGSVVMTLGLLTLLLYLLRSTERSYLNFSAMSLLFGLYLISRAPIRSFLFEEPSLWRHIELASLCLLGAAASAFVARVFAEGPLSIMRGFTVAFGASFTVGLLLLAFRVVHLESLLPPLQYLWMAFFVTTAGAAVLLALRGNTDGRIFAIGLLLAAMSGVYDLLISFDLVPYRTSPTHLGAIAFEGALGIILARRFFAVQKQMRDYETVMQLNLAAPSDGTALPQEQLALAELLRMLDAERALLFLTRPASPDEEDAAAGSAAPPAATAAAAKKTQQSVLELAAARDAQGQMGLALSGDLIYDEQLVAAVRDKGRPLMRMRLHSATRRSPRRDDGSRDKSLPGLPPQSLSVMAAPLLAGGQVIGVLYLEADAKRRTFGRADVEILLGLANQVALTLMTSRAVRLEHETQHAQRRLDEQDELLTAAARLAHGDLQTPIAVGRKSSLAPLAAALEHMRKDLQTHVQSLVAQTAAAQQSNEELRRQMSLSSGAIPAVTADSTAEGGRPPEAQKRAQSNPDGVAAAPVSAQSPSPALAPRDDSAPRSPGK